MRWPIKTQMVLMFVTIAVTTVLALTLINGYVSYRQSEEEIKQDLNQIADALSDSSFPVTDATLRQIKGLSGTELLLIDQQQDIAATTLDDTTGIVEKITQLDRPQGVSLQEPFMVAGRSFYLTTVQSQTLTPYGQPGQLYILYPQQTYARQMRRAWMPPAITGLFGSLFVALIGVVASARFTRKLSVLRDQVNVIADGNFKPLPVPRRNDEIRDLSIAINRMSDKLEGYEKQIRIQERQKTFNQIGRAIAHEIRNAVTGGRMAIDLHRRQHPSAADSEYLDVSLQQMRMMERSVDRFLKMGDTQVRQNAAFDCVSATQSALSLVEPMAEHLEVEIRSDIPAEEISLVGNAGDLEQALINLLINAIHAAAEGQAKTESQTGFVHISIENQDDSVIFRVSDSGAGPTQDIESKLFESFCTDKPDGIGLGLSLTRQIVLAHQGTIDWNRQRDQTCFFFEIPKLDTELN